MAALEEGNVGGYSATYGREDSYFPVYATAALAAIFLTAAWITGALYWLVPALAAAAFTYYNIPLLETGRPTIGANQYGIFIQALGLIRWRAIERIDLVEIAERAMTVHELQIVLNAALSSALVADWRKQWLGFDAWAAVEVVNATPEPDGTRRHFFLQVPANIRTAREAVAWTYGLRAEAYAKLVART